jgi:aminopeptidase N
MRDSTGTVVLRSDYLPPPFIIDSVDLTFDLDPHATYVRAVSQVRRSAHTPGNAPLVLDGHGIGLARICIDGASLTSADYVQEDHTLTIARVPDAFSLEIEGTIAPAANKALQGLYASGTSLCTQCEAEGFRNITYFLDRPDVMARYRTTLRADKTAYPVLLSNGNCTERGDLPDGRHYAVWDDPFPKPSYLFALVAGNLARAEDKFVTRSGRSVALHIFVEAGHLDQTAHAMASLKRAMRWDEEVYGREYDLDVYMIVAVRDFNMGAMENKGLNVFNAKYVLARPDTATDLDFHHIEVVVAHEYFHNWSGNRVTCRDWFQLSLKEGFTVFRDQEYASDVGVRAQKRVQDVQRMLAVQFPEDAGPTAHPVRPDAYEEINNFYTATVYDKGAEVVRMLHTLLGPEKFRAATDLYFDRHDGQAVTCDDFLGAMADASGRDLSQFALWYSQAGTPVLRAEGTFDAAQGTYRLTLAQHVPATPGQSEKQPMHIPVRVGLLGRDGKDLLVGRSDAPEDAPRAEHLLELRAEMQTFELTGVTEAPVPSLLRGFSAPVRLHLEEAEGGLLRRMAHDSDAYARWAAAQSLGSRVVGHALNARMAERPDVLDSGFSEAFGDALRSDSDPALVALAITLPSETVLADQREFVDPEALHKARTAVEQALGRAHFGLLRQRYSALASQGPYSMEPAAVGQRALRNVCLRYLVLADATLGTALALTQYHTATNMTDSLAALGCLASVEGSEREAALGHFYARFVHEPLVIDKWFSVQAMADRKDVLADVRQLLLHPAFDLTNPNRARALIDAFANQNPGHFHARSGAGYVFLREQVQAVDRFNGQIAARMVTPLTRFGRVEPGRRALMLAEIELLAATPSLSRDVSEQVNKARQAAQSAGLRHT